MPRRTREEAKEEILDAAMKFLSERPYRELTIPVLMAETSVERTSFYTSFASVPDLVKEVLGRVMVELRAAGWTAYFAGEGDPTDDVRIAIKAAVKVWKRHGPMLRAICEAAPLDRDLEHLWVERALGSAIEASARRIKRDQKLGLAVKGDALELATAVNRLIVAYLNERLGRATPVGRKVSAATIERTLQTMVIGAIYGHTTDDLTGESSSNQTTSTVRH